MAILNKFLKFRELDVTIFLRAFSIFAIVSGHFGFVGLAGGAFYLILLSGYNFVKFTLPKSNLNLTFTHIVFFKMYFGFLLRIITPVLLYTATIYILLGKNYIAGFLLISNFYGPGYGEGLTFWFIEVLFQIYLLFYVISLTNLFYNWLGRAPFIGFLVGFILLFCISVLCRIFWNTSAWLDRFPHLMIYMFFLGALIASTKNYKQKLIASTCAIFVALEFYVFEFNSKTSFLIVGALITIWARTISVPVFLYKSIYLVAISSLFIYLCHFQAKSLLEKIPIDWPPFVTVSFAILVGVIMSNSWKKRSLVIQYLSSLKGIK